MFLRPCFHCRARPLIFSRETARTNWRENEVSGQVPLVQEKKVSFKSQHLWCFFIKYPVCRCAGYVRLSWQICSICCFIMGLMVSLDKTLLFPSSASLDFLPLLCGHLLFVKNQPNKKFQCCPGEVGPCCRAGVYNRTLTWGELGPGLSGWAFPSYKEASPPSSRRRLEGPALPRCSYTLFPTEEVVLDVVLH